MTVTVMRDGQEMVPDYRSCEMRLQDVLDDLNQLSEDRVIFARKPWALDSEAEIGALSANLRVPPDVASRGFEYFLEVSVAREVLEVFRNREPTAEQRRALLMYYAHNDAYPEWVYDS